MKIVQTTARWLGTAVLTTGLLVGMASASGGRDNGWHGGSDNWGHSGWGRSIGWHNGWHGGSDNWGHFGWNNGWNNWNR